MKGQSTARCVSNVSQYMNKSLEVMLSRLGDELAQGLNSKGKIRPCVCEEVELPNYASVLSRICELSLIS